MISEILPEEKRRLHELEVKLGELERGNPHVDAVDVTLGLDEITNRLAEMDRLVNNEPKNRRDDFRRRVEHLRATHKHIKNSLESLLRRNGANPVTVNHSLLQQRQELFQGSNGDPYSNPNMDLEMAESGSLDRSSRLVGGYLEQGQETLSELISQRERLKGVQAKVLDIMNYLGVSNKIMKAVGDRENIDRYIVYTGIFVVTLVVFLLIWFR